MTGFREWATAAYEAGNRLADNYSRAMARALDGSVFHGTTTSIQENHMTDDDGRLTHYVNNGGMVHAMHDPAIPAKGTENPAQVTCAICRGWLADAARITEVSATVDAGLDQETLDGMSDAERLGLIVGAAYGKALAERDEARDDLWEAVARLEEVLATYPETSFAHSNVAVDAAREFVRRIRKPQAVDSEATPDQQED